jgi:hypothetical protein
VQVLKVNVMHQGKGEDGLRLFWYPAKFAYNNVYIVAIMLAFTNRTGKHINYQKALLAKSVTVNKYPANFNATPLRTVKRLPV